MKSARALKEAADTMCESPAALQLRYLQVSFKSTLSRIHWIILETRRWHFAFLSPTGSFYTFKLFFFVIYTWQTLNSIAAEKNSTIIFPLPIDLISPLMNLVKRS